jgi:hypothetical protein
MANRSPFSDEFKAAHDELALGKFSADWKSIVAKLVLLTDANGPHDGYADALNDVRKRATRGADNGILKKAGVVTESDGLLSATGGYNFATPTATTGLDAAAIKRAAALKLLRHLHLVRQRGSHKLWILSLARSFNDWPSEALKGANMARLRLLMNDSSDWFSDDDKKHLSECTHEALKWVQKALILLAEAVNGKDKAAAPGLAMVKLWFCDATASADDIKAAAKTLQAGFKKIQGVLGSGRLLLTDHPEVRGATTGPNAGFLASEAFVKGAREAMDVVYIESAFFSSSNTLKGLVNWTRILVHELSHRELATVDKFYSWQGMGPNASGFPTADALVNADSWAFFCVDAAGQMTATERTKALQ